MQRQTMRLKERKKSTRFRNNLQGNGVVHFTADSFIRKNSRVMGVVLSNRPTCCYRPRNVANIAKTPEPAVTEKRNEKLSPEECRANIFWAISEEAVNSFDFIPTRRTISRRWTKEQGPRVIRPHRSTLDDLT